MAYAGSKIAPHKIQSHLGNAFMILFYYVIDEDEKVFDRLNAVYDGESEVTIYSHKEEAYIDRDLDDPYFNFIHDELNTHRIVQDALQSIKAPVSSDGIIRPWTVNM